MPKEDNKILKYKHVEKSMKVPFIIYANLESWLEKINANWNSPEKSSTTKINKHTPSGYSLFSHCSRDATRNTLDYYRGKYYMKGFCKDLRKHAVKTINFVKERKSYHRQKVCYICKKEWQWMSPTMTIKNIIKLKIIVIKLKNIEELLMIFVI